MKDRISELKEKFSSELSAVSDQKSLEELRLAFLSKKGHVSMLMQELAKINRIDQAIFESEQEIANGAEAVDAEIVFAELEKKHFG